MSQKPTAKQAQAIEALLTKPSIEAAAASVGINRRTIYRWLDDPDFKTHLAQSEGQAIDTAARRLVALSDKALNALESVLDTPGQPGAGNKRLAAQAILDNLLKLRDGKTTEERLSDLKG